MLSSSAYATPDCEKVRDGAIDALTQCINTVEEKNKVISLQKLGIQERDIRIGHLSNEVDSLREGDRALWKNPFFLIALGLVGGVALTR